MTFILAIDQGTTSSRAILFDRNLNPISTGQQEFPQIFPNSGWVEHDPNEIWSSTIESCKLALSGIDIAEVAAIGITNQRETSVVWDRKSGLPIGNAIVWQDRRTTELCANFKSEGLEKEISAKTGLLLDPYFSSTKLSWMLKTVDGARERADRGELLFGTIDSFLIWKLTGGRSHHTDATNASRTMLYNIGNGIWDQSLLDISRYRNQCYPKFKIAPRISALPTGKYLDAPFRSGVSRATNMPQRSDKLVLITEC